MEQFIFASPDNYGATVYCVAAKIEEVEDSLRDPAVWGDEFESEEWEELTHVGQDVYRDRSGNYAKFTTDGDGYYEVASRWTRYNTAEEAEL